MSCARDTLDIVCEVYDTTVGTLREQSDIVTTDSLTHAHGVGSGEEYGVAFQSPSRASQSTVIIDE